MDSATFVKDSSDLLAKYGWGALTRPVQAVAEGIFPQIATLERLRICPPIHPLRVIEHVLLAVAERPQPEAVVLALVIAALCHDTAEIPKVTKTGASPNDGEHERRRILFRLEHEARGATNLVQAIKSTDVMLKSNGQSPIGLDVVQIAYQVAVNHDAPSRDQRLPLDQRSPAGQALELFVQADTITMVEYLPPCCGAAPRWARWRSSGPPTKSSPPKRSKRSWLRRLGAFAGGCGQRLASRAIRELSGVSRLRCLGAAPLVTWPNGGRNSVELLRSLLARNLDQVPDLRPKALVAPCKYARFP